MTKNDAIIRLLPGLLLLVSTAVIYAPVRNAGFLSYDDDKDVELNAHIRGGLTPGNIQWAFTSGERSNWLPLTRLSLLLDVQIAGMRAVWFHAVNVALHGIAALALFAFLMAATGERWPSWFVTFVFALHPLHVGSVAWITERKDVLSAVFWFLALWAWVRCVRVPSHGHYLAALGWFGLGLMAKPMVVTLPFVLLLLDLWPLRRGVSRARIIEKIPFFALSAASAVITFFAQRASGAVQPLDDVSFPARIANALISYLAYLVQTIFPAKMAVFYPYPPHVRVFQAVLAMAVLAAVSALVIHERRDRPWLAVGWLWFLVTLVPVIGIVQVGHQSRADRYMYVPMVGLAIMAAWDGAEVIRRMPRAKAAVWAIAVGLCLAMGAITERQTRYWHDSETLYRHTIAVTDDNYEMYFNLGNVVGQNSRRLPEAEQLLRECLRIMPDYAEAHNNLGAMLARMGRRQEALDEFRTSATLRPDFANPHSNTGALLVKIPGRSADALREFETAIRLDPNLGPARAGLGDILANMPGRMQEAEGHLERAVELSPEDGPAQDKLGVVLERMGRQNEAVDHFEEAVRLDPNDARARLNLAAALSRWPERRDEAIENFEAALRLKPDPALRASVDQFEGKR